MNKHRALTMLLWRTIIALQMDWEVRFLSSDRVNDGVIADLYLPYVFIL